MIGIQFAHSLGTTLHQPFRGGGGAANPYALNTGEPRRIDQFGVVDQVRIGIDLATGLEKHTPVAAFESADEENEVVALGKFLHPGQSIRNAATNGVVTTELCRRLNVGGEVIDECLEPFERFGGLREEISVAREVDFCPLR